MNERGRAIHPKDGHSGGKTTQHAALALRAAAGALLVLSMASGKAGAETLVSNLEETSSETLTVGYVGDHKHQSVAVRFSTGSGYGRGFQLDKVRLKTSIDPNHSGRTPEVVIRVFNEGSNVNTPGTTMLAYLPPRRVENGTMTFDASTAQLGESNTYWLHISVRYGNTSFRVHLTSSTAESGEDGWSIDDATRYTVGLYRPDWSQSNEGASASMQFEMTGNRRTRANLQINGPDSINEGTTGRYRFQLSATFGSPTVITYSTTIRSDDTASTDDFEVITSQTATIPANTHYVEGIRVPVTQDDISEDNEYFSLSIDSISPEGHASPPRDNRKRIKIDKSDFATVTLVGQDQTVAEGASATFTLQVDRATSRDFAVPIHVESDSMLDSEWNAPAQVSFTAGETSKTFRVQIKEDGNAEGAESLTVRVGGNTVPNGVADIHERTRTVSVPANTTRTPISAGIAVINYTYSEENPDVFFEIELTRASSATIHVDYHTEDITADSPADYNAPRGRATFPPGTTSVKVPVNVVNDTLVENTERFRIVLSGKSSSDPELQVQLTPSQGQMTITDSDEGTLYLKDAYRFVPTGTIVYEDEEHIAATAELAEPVGYDFAIVLRSKINDDPENHPLFDPPTQANAERDYVDTSETVRFFLGEVSKTLEIPLVDNDIPEFIEYLSVELKRNGVQDDIQIHEEDKWAYYVIYDDEPLFMVEDTDTTSVELTEPKGAGTRENRYITIAIQSPMRETVSVDWALEEAGTNNTLTQPSYAIDGTHFVAASGRATFAPGQTERQIPITLIGNGKAGWTQELNLTLSNPNPGKVQAPSGYDTATLADTHTYPVRIADADRPAMPTIVAPRSVVEGNSLTYHIRIDRPTDSQLKCRTAAKLTAGQAADNDIDSGAALGTLLIGPAETNSAAVTFSVHTDSDAEPPELFTLTATCEPNAASTLGQGTPVDTRQRTHGVTIYDADPKASPAGIIATTGEGEKVLQQILTLPEGGTSTDIVIALRRPPTGYVRLGFRPVGADPDIIIGGSRSHTFTAENWREPYIITVSAREDADNTNGDTELDLSFRSNSLEYNKAGSFGQRRIWLREDDNDAEAGAISQRTDVPGAPNDGVAITQVVSEQRHDGKTDAIIEMEFDAPLGVTYATMKNHAWEVDGGWIRRVQRISGSGGAAWRFWARPHGKSQMALFFNVGTDCTTQTAICSKDPARPIKHRYLLAIPGPGTSTGDFAKTHLGRPVFNLYAGPASAVDEQRTEERVNESDGVINFTITATPAPTTNVSVEFSTHEGTARHGHDVVGITDQVVTFAASESTKTVPVTIVLDSTDEGEETIYADITNPVGGTLGRNTFATGIIANDGPMPRAWIARFGRTAAEHASETITARLAEPRGKRSDFALAGIPSREGPEEADTPTEPWDEDPLGTTRTLTPEELLGGTSFHFETNAGPMDRSFAAWGSVTQGGFDGEEDGHSVTGTVTTLVAGADTAYHEWTTGLAVAHSEGKGAFGSDIEVDTATLTSLHPYVSWAANDTSRLWGILGYGSGTLRWDEKPSGETTRYSTDLTGTMAAAGTAKDLLARENANGLDLTAKTDVLWTRTESDAQTGLAAARARTGRIRALIEARATLDALTGTIDTGVRHDSGDAEQGFGIETGAELNYERTPLKIGVKGRAILAHEDSDFRTWSLTGRIAWKAAPTGLRLGLEPRIGESLDAATLYMPTTVLCRQCDPSR